MNISSFLTSDVIEAIATQTGENKSAVKKVLEQALPQIIEGMQKKASTEKGAQDLQKTIEANSVPTRGGLSLLQGATLLTSLMGTNSVAQTVSQSTNTSTDSTNSILTAALPLLMSSMSSQTSGSGNSGTTNLLLSLLGGSNSSSSSNSSLLGSVADLAGSLLGGGKEEEKPAQEEESSSLLGGIFGALGNLISTDTSDNK